VAPQGFPLGALVRFREQPRPAAHQTGVGRVVCVPAAEDAPQTYGVHHRTYDSGKFEPFTAYFAASQLELIDGQEPGA
jgi:hypothetical protein